MNAATAPTIRKPRSLTVLMPLAESRRMTFECHDFLAALWALYDQLDVRYVERAFPGGDKDEARAELLAAWYACDDTEDALFVDSDQHAVDPMGLVIRQMATLEEPLLVAPTLMRTGDDPWMDVEKAWMIDGAGGTMTVEKREGVRMLPIRGTGLGFTRIRRSAYGRLLDFYGQDPSVPRWESHAPTTRGMPVLNLFAPLVHEHPDGSGKFRRRPEDMSFFRRALDAGIQPYALVDAIVMHDGKGGMSFMQALQAHARHKATLRKHALAELAECPDDLLEVVHVLDGAYDVPGLEFDTPPRVLDLGANVGAFAVFAARRWPGAAIACYEPHPDHLRMLERNTAHLVPAPTIHAYGVVGQGALGDVDLSTDAGGGRMRLWDPLPGKNGSGSRSFLKTDEHADTFTDVPTIAASSLPPCQILKIDTEGCERSILESYPHLSTCRAVLCEWHSPEDYRWICGTLAALGFKLASETPTRELCFVRRDAPRSSAILSNGSARDAAPTRADP